MQIIWSWRRYLQTSRQERILTDLVILLLPRFSCHNLRHTFTTRLIEAGVNPKVVQDTLGHKDISTTLGIYASVSNDFKKSAYDNMAINNVDIWGF